MVYTSLFMSFSINENSNAFHSYFKNEWTRKKIFSSKIIEKDLLILKAPLHEKPPATLPMPIKYPCKNSDKGCENASSNFYSVGVAGKAVRQFFNKNPMIPRGDKVAMTIITQRIDLPTLLVVFALNARYNPLCAEGQPAKYPYFCQVPAIAPVFRKRRWLQRYEMNKRSSNKLKKFRRENFMPNTLRQSV